MELGHTEAPHFEYVLHRMRSVKNRIYKKSYTCLLFRVWYV